MSHLISVGKSIYSRSFVAAGLALVLFSFENASAQNLKVKLESNEETSLPMIATSGPNGNITYDTTQIVEESLPNRTVLHHTVSCSFTLFGSNIGTYNETVYVGQIKIETDANTPGPRNFTVSATFPSMASYLNVTPGGAGSIKINPNSNANNEIGKISCSDQPTGDSIVAFLRNVEEEEEDALGIQFCPFQLIAGAGSQATNYFSVQDQLQSLNTYSFDAVVGMKVRAKITPGDKGTFTLIPFAGLPPCPSDFNSDNEVNGVDLAHFLGNWGNLVAGMECDVNVDGKIDVQDLVVLLSAMSGCPLNQQ